MIERPKVKQLLLASLMELMEIESFRDITVRMIADNASTTTRTFYNYFQDKYELLAWGIKVIIGNCISVTSSSVIWYESATNILRALWNNSTFVKSACTYIGQNDFKSAIYDSFVKTYIKWIDAQSVEMDASDEEIVFAVRFFAFGTTDIIYEWCTGGFQISPEELALKLKLCLPEILRIYFQW